MYDDYTLCKVTLGVLKGASKLNVLLLLLRSSCVRMGRVFSENIWKRSRYETKNVILKKA
jgi:hypothetical protein